ncbi:MAG: hypothetical protein HKN70_04625 [Gammaproteobacteria bacterium]|nr:hypothetical protein [Gammaproteobacteria bacterium]
MFDAHHEILDKRVHKYTLLRDGEPLSYGEAVHLWQRDEIFRGFFNWLLIESPFTAYRWETPPVTVDTVEQSFEFILADAPRLARNPDRKAFADYFKGAAANDVVAFDNLGKDAILVVPTPGSPDSSYDQLAAFMRSAPDAQRHAFWQAVGQAVHKTISRRPLWLSTAGVGVAWLHVRLDSRPKYYSHLPYTGPA